MAMTKQCVNLDLLFHSKESKHDRRTEKEADQEVVTCMRCLAMDAVQKANSGHPGTPMALAPVAYALWARILKYDPDTPTWWNRDRFVLSVGHASMLLYALLHVAGVKDVGPDGKPLAGDNPAGDAVPLDGIKNFRQLHSSCPGHPEYRHTAGVEMTTGPLGQGLASSVGMAIGAKWLAAKFNRPNYEVFDYDVFALCGDGDMQEGMSGEAASLAGHLKLDNLCWMWDNNQISIEGNTAWAFSEDLATRFIAYGWNVLRVGDANDIDALTRSIMTAKREKQRPTLIIVDSHIAWGAPTKQDHFHAHGNPLGEDEVAATKEIYGWSAEKFWVPDSCRQRLRGQMLSRGGIQRKEWDAMFSRYQAAHPREASMLERMMRDDLPDDWDKALPKEFPPDPKGVATRASSSSILNALGEGLPWLIGGSADLGNSCLTLLNFEGAGDFMAPSTGWGTYGGRNLHFGIREHAMGAITNGLALTKLRAYCSTFFCFSDYMKPAMRLAAIMELPNLWIFTHDSIGVGEDGPTHQPIEQLAMLRAVPGFFLFRPCDANEVLESYRFIAKLRHEPAALVLTRQTVPTLDRKKYGAASGLTKGAYIIAGAADETPDVILMATGSEVAIMLEAHEALAKDKVKVRSVSMPCIGLFKLQPPEYIRSVLPDDVRARVSVEAATRDSWGDFTGLDGEHVGMVTFGLSAPAPVVQKECGITAEEIIAAARRVMAKRPRFLADYADAHRKWKKRNVSTH